MKKSNFTRLGFILAASGSAVGLGNIWKFPYITGEYGGGAFVLVYLLSVVFIGFSILLAEMSIGYLGKKSVSSSFVSLSSKKWAFSGFMAFTGFLILSFYSVVIGWIFRYLFLSLEKLPSNIEEAQETFTSLITTDIYTQIAYLFFTTIVVVYFVSKGISSGIEKLNRVLMPSLILIIIGMFIYSLNLDGFSKAFSFMFNFDFSKLSSSAVLSAVGHSFFTLSLGMGAILTYSASMPKKSSLPKSALYILLLDTTIAILAGLLMFTFLYTYGSEPAKGPGLVFISLPTVFFQLGEIGKYISFFFFLALSFAGVTSAVSILEPSVKLLCEKFKTTREKVSLSLGSIFFSLGVLALLSNSKEFGSKLTFYGKNLFDWFDYTTTNILLPLGGFVIAIFVGFVVEKQLLRQNIQNKTLFRVWYFSIRYIVPISLIWLVLDLLGIIF